MPFHSRLHRRALSGVTSQPYGPRVSLVSMGDAAAPFSASTKCSDIAAGDPYRVPGNRCTGNDGSAMTFDSTGAAIPVPFSIGDLFTPTNLAIAAGAWFLFLRKKR